MVRSKIIHKPLKGLLIGFACPGPTCSENITRSLPMPMHVEEMKSPTARRLPINGQMINQDYQLSEPQNEAVHDRIYEDVGRKFFFAAFKGKCKETHRCTT